MDDKVIEALAGTMGSFWTDLAGFPEADHSRPGHAEHSGQHFVVRTIKRSGSLPAGGRETPSAVYGRTEVGGLVAYDIRAVPETSHFGGNKISVRSYLARGFALGVDPASLASPNVVAITAHFHGLVMWSGMTGGQVEHEKYPDGRVKEITYSTRRVEPISRKIGSGRTVELGVTWSASERQFDQFSASTPLTFTVTKSKPGSWYDAIRPIMAFQDLVSMAYDAFVPCIGGSVLPHQKKGAAPTKGALWSGVLMDVPEGVERSSEKSMEYPAFSLGSIGSMAGLRRWILLADKHPRAVGPLTTAKRFGTSTVEVELMNIAVAIEYWVGACKKETAKRPKWTATSKKISHAQALAVHVGSEFRTFVGGDERRWARLFWNRYTALKHDPLISYDVYEIDTLMRGGRVLLMCALLNRVATSKAPTRWICDSHRFHNLGVATRDLIASNPKLFER